MRTFISRSAKDLSRSDFVKNPIKGKVDLTKLDLSGSGIVKLVIAAVIIIMVIAAAKWGAGKLTKVVKDSAAKAQKSMTEEAKTGGAEEGEI